MPLDFNVIGKRMPAGFPGQVARESFNIVETYAIDGTDPVTVYGAPVVRTAAGLARTIKSGDTAAAIIGFSVRPDAVQLGGDNPATWADAGIPDPKQPLDVMVKGYMNVMIYGDVTPVRGLPVYVTTAAADDVPAGAVTADSSATGAVLVTGATFDGDVDEYGMGRIRLL